MMNGDERDMSHDGCYRDSGKWGGAVGEEETDTQVRHGKAATPFVHRFARGDHKYVYDVHTMYLARVDDITWEILADIGERSKAEIVRKLGDRFAVTDIEAAYDDIRKHQEQGYFTSKRPRVELRLCEKEVRRRLAEERLILTLNVTEDCNFRCKYCVYDGHYPNRPAHARRYMSWEVAKKAIDAFLPHTHRAETFPSVTFYGGEPLLNFPLIEKCVAYIRKAYGQQEIHFGMTTNGSLLRGKIVDFLVAERFSINVSLDGPREIHDRYRRTAGDEGTWELVVNNLRELLRRYPEHRHRMGFMTVLAPPLDLVELNRYFAQEELLSLITRVQTNIVDPRCDFGSMFSGEEALKVRGYGELEREYLSLLCNGTINHDQHSQSHCLLNGLFRKEFIGFHKRLDRNPRAHMPEVYCSLATCVPGTRRTFVSVDGDYWPCERVTQSEYLKIGNVEDGLNVPKILGMLQEWVDLSKKECESCWCLKTCGVGCFATICDGEKPTAQTKREACQRHREMKERLMQQYCMVLEQNPHNFDFLDPIMVT